MVNQNKKNMLIIVEGEKTDFNLMKKIFSIYPELDMKYNIVPYKTNIYVLYQELFLSEDDLDSIDLLQLLKSKEKDISKKAIFDYKYTDIILIFDLDPQDQRFNKNNLLRMQDYFKESSDMGKLYLNYPMVESFYHMTEIPDDNYIHRIVELSELENKTYKSRVNNESKGKNYRRFLTHENRSEKQQCNQVIKHNIEKALFILKKEHINYTKSWIQIDAAEILKEQLNNIELNYIYVLCTCIMFVYDYDSKLILDNLI